MLDAPHSMMNKFDGPSNANFLAVSNVIRDMVEKAKTIAVSQQEGIHLSSLSRCSNVCRGIAYVCLAFHLYNEHFVVSRRLNPLFTGREEELVRLKQALCPSLSANVQNKIPKIYIIYGMGGAGKSEVALKFAHEHRLEYE